MNNPLSLSLVYRKLLFTSCIKLSLIYMFFCSNVIYNESQMRVGITLNLFFFFVCLSTTMTTGSAILFVECNNNQQQHYCHTLLKRKNQSEHQSRLFFEMFWCRSLCCLQDIKDFAVFAKNRSVKLNSHDKIISVIREIFFP